MAQNARMPSPVFRLFPAHEYRRERWRNGAGWTREILTLSDGGEHPSGGDGWELRLSIAEIEAPAAYSCFPGMCREQVLLTGSGLQLQFGDGQQASLEPPHQRLRFPGDRKVSAAPVDGRVEVFNAIWRPSRLEVAVMHRPLVGSLFCFADVTTSWVLYLLGGQARVTGDGVAGGVLGNGDSAWLASAGRCRFAVEGGGELLLLRLDRVGG